MRADLALLRTTTFRLALAQAGVVLGFVVLILIYVYFATVGQLNRDSDALADQEFAALERAYGEGGIRRLNQEVVERAALQGPFLYVLAEGDGRIVSGDFERFPVPLPGESAERVDFGFELSSDGEIRRGRARGQVGRLLNGPILLVARDLGDGALIAGRITRALWTVAAVGLLFSVASGLFGAWLASRRVEELTNTTRDVMAGDLSRRAPVRGEGDEFDALALAINAMLDRIERLMLSTRTAGDAIAHDLRSPLTRFRHRLESALEQPPNSDSDREALRKALEEADRLLDMFSAILRLARVESNAEWPLDVVDATGILRELVEFYEPAADEQGRSLHGEVSEGLRLRGDAGLFTQAVSNLIENALKYTPEGGHVEVRAVQRPDGRIEVVVADDGPGIAPSERERALERFVRLDSSRTTPGAGLGLSLVAAVARLHRGGLHLRDGIGGREDSKGLSAALVIPALESPVR
jgi:signal transduction histidine kinase